MTDVAHFGFSDDVACSFYLVEKFGVATVPGSAFYKCAELGRAKVRFAFPKKSETLQIAAERLRNSLFRRNRVVNGEDLHSPYT